MKHYEYMTLHSSVQQDEWSISYLGKAYPRKKYLQAIMDYLGNEGWELVSTTAYNSGEHGSGISAENFYFKREREGAKKAALQALIDEIDRFTHELDADTSQVEKEMLSGEEIRQLVLEHLYNWLKHHDFEWGQPGYGVIESHYLTHMEDVTGNRLFEGFSDKQKVSIRIDVFKESDSVAIMAKKRIKGDWIDTNRHLFSYSKEGLDLIRSTLRMDRNSLVEL